MSSLKGTAWDWRELRPIRRCDGGVGATTWSDLFFSFFKLTFHGGGGRQYFRDIRFHLFLLGAGGGRGHGSTISVSICFVFRRCHHFLFFSTRGFSFVFALSFLFFLQRLVIFYYYEAMGLGLDWVGGVLAFFSLLFFASTLLLASLPSPAYS